MDLAKEFDIKGYPTFVMLNADGQVLDRWIGYSKDQFISTMASATVDPVPIDTRLARYGSKPDLNDALVLARYSSSLNKYSDAVNYYNKAQELNDHPDRDYLYDIFINTAYGARQDSFTFEDAAKAARAVLGSANTSPDDKYSVARNMTSLAKKNEKPEDAAPFIEAGIKAFEGSDNPDDLTRYNNLMTDYSMYITKDLDKAVVYKKASMPEGWSDNAGQLNNFAWWCFENNANLEEAEKLSRKSVKLAEPGHERAMFLDTLAEICNSLGKSQEAVDLTKTAITEDPKDDYFKGQLEKFEKIVASHDKG